MVARKTTKAGKVRQDWRDRIPWWIKWATAAGLGLVSIGAGIVGHFFLEVSLVLGAGFLVLAAVGFGGHLWQEQQLRKGLKTDYPRRFVFLTTVAVILIGFGTLAFEKYLEDSKSKAALSALQAKVSSEQEQEERQKAAAAASAATCPPGTAICASNGRGNKVQNLRITAPHAMASTNETNDVVEDVRASDK